MTNLPATPRSCRGGSVRSAAAFLGFMLAAAPSPAADGRDTLRLGFGANPPSGRPKPSKAAVAPSPPVQFGYSRQIFDSVNENDGRAALKLHAEAIGRMDGIAMANGQLMFDGVAAMNRALETGAVDLLALPADEFVALKPALVIGPLIVAVVQGRLDDEYLLVVRRDRGIANLAGLSGRRIAIQQGTKAPFSLPWLDILALREGLGPAARLFGDLTASSKPSRVVLPVFFRQLDGCVVMRRSLDVLGELNPQISRELRVLATSPSIVPSVLCFRAGLPQATIDRIVASARKMPTTVSGRQVTTIFQSDGLKTMPLAAMDDARALLAERARLVSAFHASIAAPGSLAHPLENN